MDPSYHESHHRHSFKAHSSARSVGKHESYETDVAVVDEESAAVNGTSFMLEGSPRPDCELLRHRVDEDPRWNFGKIANYFPSWFGNDFTLSKICASSSPPSVVD